MSATTLELWADAREAKATDPCPRGTTRRLVDSQTSGFTFGKREYVLHDAASGNLYNHDRTQTLGIMVSVRNPQDVAKAISLVGTVDWVVISSFEDWTLIPIENILAAAQGSPTRVCVAIQNADQIQGAAFALQTGVDALLLDPIDEALWEVARQAQAQKDERARGNANAVVVETAGQDDEAHGQIALVEARVTEVVPGGVGDRVCLDLVQMLKEGEGCLVGSSAKALVLVQAEVLATSYINSRPFRVNAGPVHSYVLMEDGSSKYLSEVQAGDMVRVVNAQGQVRGVTVGRCKIESRPVMRVAYAWQGKTAQVFLQQAETVRFVSTGGKSLAITELKAGDVVLVRSRSQGTHLGRAIEAKVEEK